MRSTFSALCLGLATTLAMPFAGAGAVDTVELSRADGGAAVRTHPKLPWKPASTGSVKIGSQVRCDGTCQVVLGGGATLDFEAAAEVTIDSPRFAKLGGVVAEKADVIRLVGGHATLRHRGDAPVLILAGGRELVLDGGTAELSVSGHRVAVALESGSLSLGEGRTWQRLEQGKIHVFGAEGREMRSLPAAPSFRDDIAAHRPLGLADAPEGAVSLAWRAAPEASAVHLEIADDASFTRVVHSATVPSAQGRAEIRLREGAYHARIAMVDRDGFRSSPSAAIPVRVVRVALPDGGIVPKPGIVVLPGGTSLRLLAVDGLEMSLGRRGFVPAVREIPLGDSHGVLKLRVKGHPSTESSFALEPRALEANVTMAPFAPIWPSDSVDVRVALDDPRGHYDVDGIEPRLRVHLDDEELFVTFTKKDGAYHGRIHGRRLDRPRLLKVSVEDRAGRSLGRSLVEVVSSR